MALVDMMGKLLVAAQRWLLSLLLMANTHLSASSSMTRPWFPYLLLLGALSELPDRAQAGDPPSIPPAIVYRLDGPGQVSAAIYDKTGRQVRTLSSGEKQSAGQHISSVGRPGSRWQTGATRSVRMARATHAWLHTPIPGQCWHESHLVGVR